MNLSITTKQKIAGQWFRQWFDSPHYHRLYAKRNEVEANEFIDRLMAELEPPVGSYMLDAGCGAGRHCKHLHTKGFNVTGFDLAFTSIQLAKRSETENLKFFTHDMRKPFGKNHFDYVFNFFTSFGYFNNHDDNLAVIRNFSNALKPGAILMIDYLNASYVLTRLIPSEEKEIDGIIYRITRWTDDRFIFKKIVIDGEQMGESIEHTEQVARFSAEDFSAMFTKHNLVLERVYGDYQLNEYDPTLSPRMIMIARKLH